MTALLCAACGTPEQHEPTCAACGASVLLDGRYRLLAVVGQGAMGTTYRAEVCATGAAVAIKEIIIRAADLLRQRALFDRELAVLRALDHPGVPRYVDHLDSRDGKVWNLYLVQAFVEGETLERERKRRRYTEAEVCEVLAALADILTYLHGLRPPVVHRDLKPSNVMRRRDGQLVLIDFGSVKGALDPDLGGSTVAGTFGYMPPEQLVGRAEPASDLYALGMIGAVLLTGRDAVDLVEHDGQVRWRAHTRASDALAGLIDDLLVRDPEARPQFADAVATRLRAVAVTGVDPAARFAPSRADAPDLRVTLPPAPRPVSLRSVSDAGTAFLIPFGLIFATVGTIVGGAFIGVGFWGPGDLIFGLVGIGALTIFGGAGFATVGYALRKLWRARRLVRWGAAVEGVVESAAWNTSVTVNGRNPLVLRYRYAVDGRDFTAQEQRFDDNLPADLTGARVTVVVDPKDAARTRLWLRG